MSSVGAGFSSLGFLSSAAKVSAERLFGLVARSRFQVRWITRRQMHGENTSLLSFARGVLRNHRREGGPLFELLNSLHSGGIPHSVVSDQVTTVAQGVDVSRSPKIQLETLERMCQNFGLHRAAGAFALKARERIIWEADLFRVPAAIERDLVSSMHWGDLPRAEMQLGSLQSLKLSPSQRARLETYETYMRLWAPSSPPIGDPKVPSRFFDAVREKRILVYGPGETSSTSLESRDFDLVARTCGYGKYVFDSPGDLVTNQTDIAYVNPEVFEIGGPELRAKALDQLSQYAFVVTKRTAVDDLENNRVSTNLGPLFLRGHPHKGTQMILDLLVHQPQELWVIGMSFFLARNAYRPDSLGVNALTLGGESGEQTHDPSGSEGGPFDLNWQYASHNLRENFGLIRNLYGSGVVNGDSFFSRVMSLSIEGYLRELDAIAGEPRA
jgi:hypothetical protein